MTITFFCQRISNHAKQSVLSDFLTFVDANSQPNGRQEGSYSAQFFFHPKFSRIAPPRQEEKNFDDKAHTSLVSEFNRVQRELGRSTCGPTAASDTTRRLHHEISMNLMKNSLKSYERHHESYIIGFSRYVHVHEKAMKFG